MSLDVDSSWGQSSKRCVRIWFLFFPDWKIVIICPDDPRIVFFNDWGTIVMCPFLHVFFETFDCHWFFGNLSRWSISLRHKWNVPADLIARRHPTQIVVLALEPSRCTDTYRDFNLFSALWRLAVGPNLFFSSEMGTNSQPVHTSGCQGFGGSSVCG